MSSCWMAGQPASCRAQNSCFTATHPKHTMRCSILTVINANNNKFFCVVQAEEAKGAAKGAADKASDKAAKAAAATKGAARDAAAATKGAARDASATAKGAAGRAADAAHGAAEGVRGAAADAGVWGLPGLQRWVCQGGAAAAGLYSWADRVSRTPSSSAGTDVILLQYSLPPSRRSTLQPGAPRAPLAPPRAR